MTKQHNFVYITTNLINGKQYVGDHTTNNINDRYFGSGIGIVRAVKKYGKKNFKKEILENFELRYLASEAQEKYIKQFNTLVPNGYNICPKGGIKKKGEHSEETKKKMRKRTQSEKTKEKTRETIFKRNFSPEAIEKYLESIKHTHYSPDFDKTIHIPFKR